MGNRKGHSALPGYTYKEFKELLANEGFFEHHKNSAHMIFANKNGYYVTIPAGASKEINHMMTTVSLQRIKNNQCRKMSTAEYQSLKQY